METVTKRLYEALVLMDSAEAAADWQGINEHIKKMFERNGAEILSMRKWDERPLAYTIRSKNRGTYILIYFNSLSDKIAPIERDCQLSERIVRVLILRGDHITKADMEKETPIEMAEKQGRKPLPVEPEEAPAVEQVPSVIDIEDIADSEEEDLESKPSE